MPLSPDKKHIMLDCTCRAEVHYSEEDVAAAVAWLREQIKTPLATNGEHDSMITCRGRMIERNNILQKINMAFVGVDVQGGCEKGKCKQR